MFLFKWRQIKDEETVKELEIKQDDIIEVFKIAQGSLANWSVDAVTQLSPTGRTDGNYLRQVATLRPLQHGTQQITGKKVILNTLNY